MTSPHKKVTRFENTLSSSGEHVNIIIYVSTIWIDSLGTIMLGSCLLHQPPSEPISPWGMEEHIMDHQSLKSAQGMPKVPPIQAEYVYLS